MNSGNQAQNSGVRRPQRTGSVDSSLQTKVVRLHPAVRPRLIITADFMALGSRQTSTGRLTISMTRLMMGSVILKCF